MAPENQLSHLNHAVLTASLVKLWMLPTSDNAVRDRAAQDRGFSGFEHAVEAFRPFLLRLHLQRESEAELTGASR